MRSIGSLEAVTMMIPTLWRARSCRASVMPSSPGSARSSSTRSGSSRSICARIAAPSPTALTR